MLFHREPAATTPQLPSVGVFADAFDNVPHAHHALIARPPDSLRLRSSPTRFATRTLTGKRRKGRRRGTERSRHRLPRSGGHWARASMEDQGSCSRRVATTGLRHGSHQSQCSSRLVRKNTERRGRGSSQQRCSLTHDTSNIHACTMSHESRSYIHDIQTNNNAHVWGEALVCARNLPLAC